MLIYLWIIFLIIAILFMYTVIVKDYGFYWNTVFIMFSIILFFVLAAGIMDLEFPYTVIQTDNTVVNGLHHIYSDVNITMSYFFYGLAVVMIIFYIVYVYTYIGNKTWFK